MKACLLREVGAVPPQFLSRFRSKQEILLRLKGKTSEPLLDCSLKPFRLRLEQELLLPENEDSEFVGSEAEVAAENSPGSLPLPTKGYSYLLKQNDELFCRERKGEKGTEPGEQEGE